MFRLRSASLNMTGIVSIVRYTLYRIIFLWKSLNGARIKPVTTAAAGTP